MSYADGLLSHDERVLHREKQHWFVFVWGARYTLLAIILGGLMFFLRERLSPDQKASPLHDILGWVAAILALAGMAVFAWTVLRYLNQEYVVTNRRVLQVAGVLNKTSMDSSLEKINDARLSQSVFGRMFDFGDLDILTAADTGVDRFRMLRGPIRFKRAMLDAKHEYEQDIVGGDRTPSPPLRAAPTMAPAPTEIPSGGAMAGTGFDETAATARPGGPPRSSTTADELTRTLASLADLRDRGAISTEEFERKKADLLSRL